jgi:hypothetical protein
MSSEIFTRWPVVVSLALAPDDRDSDGRLTEPAIERLFSEGRAAYFDEYSTIDGSAVEVRKSTVQPGRAVVSDDGVTVSVAVVEVYPDTFTMTARMRPAGPVDGGDDGGGIAASAWGSVSPGGAVSTAMRDELIAMAHAAKHLH